MCDTVVHRVPGRRTMHNAGALRAHDHRRSKSWHQVTNMHGNDGDSLQTHLTYAIHAATDLFAAHLVALYMVGSHATGTADAASDIDLCAVTTGDESTDTHTQWLTLLQNYSACWLDGCLLRQTELGANAPWETVGSLLAVADHGRLIFGTDIRNMIHSPDKQAITWAVAQCALSGFRRIIGVENSAEASATSLSVPSDISSCLSQASRLSFSGCILAMARALLFLRTGELVLVKYHLSHAWRKHGAAQYADWCQMAFTFKSYVASLGREESAKVAIPSQLGEAFVHFTQDLSTALAESRFSFSG